MIKLHKKIFHVYIENTDCIISIMADHYKLITFDDFSNYNFYDTENNTIAVIDNLYVARIDEERRAI